MKVVIASGGFDPIHSGHIGYLNAAKQLGDILIVGVNSDDWLIRKKGQAFLPWNERAEIVKNLKCVDQVLGFNDDDGTAIDLINKVCKAFPTSKLIFANGGDRTRNNIPEMIVPNVEFAFGIGGENKVNSSSSILESWKTSKVDRSWGYYKVIHELNSGDASIKVKELVVYPGKSLSLQRHNNRSEFWFVSSGYGQVILNDVKHMLYSKSEFLIPESSWHKLYNITTDTELKIIEIQYGSECNESDIERAD